MNDIVEEMLMHYGMPRRSGRYPYGSGEHPYQHYKDFLSDVSRMEKEGKTEKEIANEINLSTTQLRIQKSVANMERRSFDVATAKALRDKGYGATEIARKMNYPNESSIRSLLNSDSEARMNLAMKTAEFLKKQIDEKGVIDVGAGVEKELGVTRNKLDEALYILEMQGYDRYKGSVEQLTNKNRRTHLQVIGPPGTPKNAPYDYENVHSITDYRSDNDGDTFHPKLSPPATLDPKRVFIRYAEEGGIDKDGVIELRRGVEDISLGDSMYAQVRIKVGEDRYLKGMAVYSDNLPDGVDVLFNTNKKVGTPMGDVLKKTKDDPDNPFGALIKDTGQRWYVGDDGKEHLSPINKTREEGDWAQWKDKLSGQFLAKQNKGLAKQQLTIDLDDKKAEFNEIKELTNPVVKKQRLLDFASDCDASAVHLKAAALPRQKYQVILPVNSLKDNEVYAPNYKDGENVALVRFPHAGTFEIPILKVNNRNTEAKKVITPTALDAVGINSKVASQLSGADFDGDFVLTVPCNTPGNRVKISSRKPLDGLIGFDPKVSYGADEIKVDKNGVEHAYRGGREFKIMNETYKQRQMGVVSNLITDMTIGGADDQELERAVKHSMVVIDAVKHKLDYRMSEAENNILGLKKKYQTGGSSTLLSRAKSPTDIPKTKGSPTINPDGTLSYKPANEYYTNKKGETVLRTQKSTRMMDTPDARTLSSGHAIEEIYADYANSMKDLAKKARQEYLKTPNLEFVPQAAKTYAKEVEALDSKLRLAELNAPKERRAQMIGTARANAKMAEAKAKDPDMSDSEIKKLRKKVNQMELSKAREEVGASRRDVEIKITPEEWNAIQSGAITNSKLSRMIKYINADLLREYSTPYTKTEVTPAKAARIDAYKASGYTLNEIADFVGLSVSTVRKYLNN